MPNETTPTIIRRYYPTLSSIINTDDIPEILGFIKDGVQSLIDKLPYKDLPFNRCCPNRFDHYRVQEFAAF
jgi:hypothetical protein